MVSKMIVLETREDKTIWNEYASKLRNLSKRCVRNKYWKDNKMDEWYAEYKRIEQERNTILRNNQTDRHILEKKMNEVKRKENEVKRKENEVKRKAAINKRNETINKRKTMEPTRRSSRLNKNTIQKDNNEIEETANILVSLKNNDEVQSNRRSNRLKKKDLQIANILYSISQI
jgi:hypothetical protein